jgi:hypothetical protein
VLGGGRAAAAATAAAAAGATAVAAAVAAKAAAELAKVPLHAVLGDFVPEECCGIDGVQFFCFCSNRTMNDDRVVGRCRLTVSKILLKAHMVSALDTIIC